MHIARYAPTQCGTFRELPQFIALKMCVVKVNNEVIRGFGYSIIASRVPQDKSRHRNRPTECNKYFKTIGLEKIHYPVEPNQDLALEEALKTNISASVFRKQAMRASCCASQTRTITGVPTLHYWEGYLALISNVAPFVYNISRIKVKTGIQLSIVKFANSIIYILTTSDSNKQSSTCFNCNTRILLRNNGTDQEA